MKLLRKTPGSGIVYASTRKKTDEERRQVVVSAREQTVELGGTFRRIRGTQAPAVNTAADAMLTIGQDANNYYVTRCNADEDNCTIYHTVRGSRRAFLNQSVKVAKSAWHTLKLEAANDHFVVWFDGNKVLDAKDETFKDAGRVGLWTKADSVIEFDDLTVEGH